MGGSTRRVYPKANITAQWWEAAFARTGFTGIEKILLHTTETTSWPGYKAGASAPTLTYHPKLRAWRQHNFLDRSARALVDPDSTPVRENRDNVIQIEIIAYADEPMGRSVGGLPVSQLSDGALKDLGDFVGWVHQQWGGPPLVAARFIAYPGSYGASSVRMTSSQYDAFRGVLGHQHASVNAHGDPGALNVPRIMQHAAAYVAGTAITNPPPVTQEDDMQLTDTVTLVKSADVAYSTATSTVGGLLASTNYYVLQTRNKVLGQLEQQRLRDEAILAAVKGDDDAATIIAAINASAAAQLDRIAAVVRESVSADIAEDVVERIGAALTPPA